MSVNIFAGDTFDVANNLLLKKLKDDYDGTGNHIILVPDRFAVCFEAKVMAALGKTACFGISVYSFARLARKFVREQNKCLTPQASVMLLGKVIAESRDDLAYLGRASKNPSFINDMYAVLTQIRNSGVSVLDLRRASADMSAAICKKTLDIALLYERYLQALGGKYNDSGTLLQTLASELGFEPTIKKTHIYVAEFFEFNGMQYELLKQLINGALDFNIALVESIGKPNARIFPHRIEKTLRRIAQSSGIKVEKVFYQDELRLEKKVLLDNLFSYVKASDSVPNQDFADIFVASNIKQEIEFAAREITRLVREEGLRYKEIAVVCGNIEGNSGLCDKVFSDFDIPHFIDNKRPLGTQPGVRLIKDAMRCVIKNFRQKEVFNYLKNPLIEIAFADKCTFENYCIKYAVDYGRFLEQLTLGEDANINEAIRKRLVSAPKLLKQEAASYADFAELIKKFLINADFVLEMQKLAKKQDKLGEREDAEMCAVACDKLQSVLEQIGEIFGDKKTTLEEFYFVFCAAVDSFEIALAPMYNDSVFIGGITQSRYDNVRRLFVIGACEGAIPVAKSYLGILGQRECAAFKNSNLELYPDAKEQTMLEKFYLLQVLLKPKEKLTMSYHTQNDSGKVALPSTFLQQVENLLGCKTRHITEIFGNDKVQFYTKILGSGKNLKKQFAEDFGRRKSYDYAQDLPEMAIVYDALAQYFKGDEFAPEDYAIRLADADKYVWKAECGKLYSSASKLERYLDCPYKYYAESVLKIKEREQCELSVLERGNVYHQLLEIYFKKHKDKVLSRDQVVSETKQILDFILSNPQYTYYVANKDNLGFLRALYNDCVFLMVRLCEKLSGCGLKPSLFEAGFGAGDTFDEVPIDLGDKTIFLRGKIDRIDRLDKGFVIIDYKSKASVNFGLKEVFYGERIQLFAYLYALIKAEFGVPLGLFYLPLSVKYRDEEKVDNRLCYSGFVIKDIDTLQKIDSKLKEMQDGKNERIGSILPIKIKTTKDGTVKITGMNTLDTDNFYAIAKYVMQLIKAVAKDMSAGIIAPNPKENSCEYCNYSTMCKRKKLAIVERSFSNKKVCIDSFYNAIEKEGKHNE